MKRRVKKKAPVSVAELKTQAEREGLSKRVKPKASVEFEHRKIQQDKSKGYSGDLYGAYDPRWSVMVDKGCLDAEGNVLVARQGAGVLLRTKMPKNCLLHVELLSGDESIDDWKTRVRQYADLTRSLPKNTLKFEKAWLCDSSDVVYYGWFGSMYVGRGIVGFTLVSIPEGMVYWPLRQFVVSAADVRNGWTITAWNWIKSRFSWALATQRYVDTKLQHLLKMLYKDVGVNATSLSADHFGVLVDPKAAQPVVGSVVAPLPILLEDIRGIPGVTPEAIDGVLSNQYVVTQLEIFGGVERLSKNKAVFTPNSTWVEKMLMALSVVVAIRLSEAAILGTFTPVSEIPGWGTTYYTTFPFKLFEGESLFNNPVAQYARIIGGKTGAYMLNIGSYLGGFILLQAPLVMTSMAVHKMTEGVL